MSHKVEPISDEEFKELLRAHDILNPSREIRRDVVDSLDLYVKKGCSPGGFLTSVLENDLHGAMARADSYNRSSLYEIVQYVSSRIPLACWGSPEIVSGWLRSKSNEDDK